jgi:putative transposase
LRRRPHAEHRTMAHSYTRLVYHIVFSTKDRRPLLTPQIRPRVLAYLGGIVRNLSSAAEELLRDLV